MDTEEGNGNENIEKRSYERDQEGQLPEKREREGEARVPEHVFYLRALREHSKRTRVTASARIRSGAFELSSLNLPAYLVRFFLEEKSDTHNASSPSYLPACMPACLPVCGIVRCKGAQGCVVKRGVDRGPLLLWERLSDQICRRESKRNFNRVFLEEERIDGKGCRGRND